MRYVVAVVGSIFMFAATWFLSGLVLLLVLPSEWSQREVTLGGLQGDLAGVLALLPAGVVATHTFRASLKAKTGRRCRTKTPETLVDAPGGEASISSASSENAACRCHPPSQLACEVDKE